MNREIKFRCYIKYGTRELGKMIFLDRFYLPNQSIGWERTSCGEEDKMAMACIELKCIMQYSGLKDKNGKEIYEGDIIKGLYKDQIVFENARFKMSSWDDLLDEDLCCLLEVIGNVYENPELLTKN